MFWLHKHLPVKQALNSKQSAKGYERIIREILRSSGYFIFSPFYLSFNYCCNFSAFVEHCVCVSCEELWGSISFKLPYQYIKVKYILHTRLENLQVSALSIIVIYLEEKIINWLPPMVKIIAKSWIWNCCMTFHKIVTTRWRFKKNSPDNN